MKVITFKVDDEVQNILNELQQILNEDNRSIIIRDAIRLYYTVLKIPKLRQYFKKYLDALGLRIPVEERRKRRIRIIKSFY